MNRYEGRPNKKFGGPKFSSYEGKFPCQKCHAEVVKARFWRDTYDFTWMCECKYVSKVNLFGRGY
jgi:hypothetical protein